MAYLPGFDQEFVNLRGWSQEETIVFLLVVYLVIGTYIFLICLALRNIWVIIVRQQEYKNTPILMFYLFALIAVTIRPINVIWAYTLDPTIWNLDYIQQGAKLSVGVVQDWITLELAIRIHNS